jgi:hypothetical protein
VLSPSVELTAGTPQAYINLRTTADDIEDGPDLTYTIQSNSNSGLFATTPSISGNDVLSLLGHVDANGVATLIERPTRVACIASTTWSRA